MAETKRVELDIVTPDKLVLKENVDEVYVPGKLGEFGILAQHTPFLTMLGIGTLRVVTGGKERKFVINGGYAEVSDDKIIILTETCEEANVLDLKRARQALEESNKKIMELDAYSEEYKEHWQRAKRAQARVEVAESAD